jgi:hypothetical protein
VGLSRFGDGQLQIAFLRKSIAFQRATGRLAKMLLDILFAPTNDKVLVCFNNTFLREQTVRWILDYERSKKRYDGYESWNSPDDIGVLHRRAQAAMYREYYALVGAHTKATVLGDATVFFLGLYVDDYRGGNIAHVVEAYRSIFRGKNVLFVGPQDPLMGLDFGSLVEMGNFFECSSVKYLRIPSRDAFDDYDAIKDAILSMRTVELVCVQGGPTASVLAYELSVNHGLPTLDVGSLNTAVEALYRQAARGHSVAGIICKHPVTDRGNRL